MAHQDGAHRVVRGGAAERAGGDHGAFHAGDHGIGKHARRGPVHAEGDEVEYKPVGHLGECTAAGFAQLGRLLRCAFGHQRRDAAAPAVVACHHALTAEIYVPLDELGGGAGFPGGAEVWKSFDVHVDQVIESADYLVAQLTNTAVLRATGETVVIQNVWLFEVASGRLAGAQLYADTAAARSSAA